MRVDLRDTRLRGYWVTTPGGTGVHIADMGVRFYQDVNGVLTKLAAKSGVAGLGVALADFSGSSLLWVFAKRKLRLERECLIILLILLELNI